MPSTMFSRIAVLFTLIASAVTQDDPPQPSTTPALQSFLEISNLDASQAADLSTRYESDRSSYYSELTTEPAWSTMYIVGATGIPATAKAKAAANPDLFLASLALAESDDLPDWFTALPTPVQDAIVSVGSRDIEMYTSEVIVVRPLSTEAASSLSSFAASQSSVAEATASDAVQKGGAPSSPVTGGHMGVIAGGVAIAAGLVGMALL